MDGTGELFTDFVEALPQTFQRQTLRYPVDVCLSYAELLQFVNVATTNCDPFVLVAESFSTPLAIQFAAMNPPNLKGLVLCAGFASSPAHGWRRFLPPLLSSVFAFPLPKLAIRVFLAGWSAHPSLVSSVQTAVGLVQPKVLSARFCAVLQCDVRAELRKIAVPILYLRAKQDCLIPKPCLEEILRDSRQISVEEIPGPHLLLQREPRQTAAIVADFVQRFA